MDLQQQPLWVALAAFAVAAAFVWAAGTRLSRYLDRISNITGVGGGLLGLLVLGGVTSLPEAATVSSAALAGNAPLAVNNLLGSASINIVLLAVADALIGRRALTSVVGTPTPMLQGVLGILLLTVVAAAILVGDTAVMGIGLWPMLLVVLFGFAAWLTAQYEHSQPWAARNFERDVEDDGRGKRESGSLSSNVIRASVAAVVILAAGYVLARSGDAIATKTGIGSGLIGLVLVGFATSLPEISSIYSAVKLKRYEMALGDIFGTNIFNIVLIFLADVFFAGPPVLNSAGTFEVIATLLAILLTSIYLVGLLERRDSTVLRMGYGSLGVLGTYGAGLVLLFAIARGG